jgi:fructokinase
MSFKAVGIGEVLWDLLPAGQQLGGAPANFAHHARSLGAEACVITRVGEDNLGCEILRRFKETQIADGVVQIDSGKPTGTVGVTLGEGGLPQYTIREDVAWDWLRPTSDAHDAVRRADAICFGSLAQRGEISRATIQKLVAATRADALRIFDVNLRQHYYSREVIEQSLRLANVLKLNDHELSILGGMFGTEATERKQIQQLAAQFDLQLVALTRGPQSSLIYQDGWWSESISEPVRVVDTVGAGDAFTAALTMGLLNRMDIDIIHALAAQVASFVCAHAGATPALPGFLRDKLGARKCGSLHSNFEVHSHQPNFSAKSPS